MTNEDKKLIADYMKWSIVNVGTKKRPYVLYVDNINCNIHHHFDANSASICVQEMQKRGEWVDFYLYFICLKVDPMERRISEMLIAKNFFGAMAAWIKERKSRY